MPQDTIPTTVKAAGKKTDANDSAKSADKNTAAVASEQTTDFSMKVAGAAKAAESPAKTPAKGEAEPASDDKVKATMLGDYKLQKKLGQGGMGAVYKALKASLDKEFAIKVLSKELASKPAFVQRFKREAKVMAKLDHPNILRCYDAGEALGFHFLTMEYVEGGSVETWLKKLGKFSIGDSLHIILATAAALQHAHELNMVHRDIKPDNILLTKKGVVKVADLGLAKATDDDMSLTKTGTGAGTPIYMAPEQARDAKHVDGKVDIYALGCMLYVFLTGQPPFKGETLVELIEAKEKGKFTPIRALNMEIPERLDLICEKMMAKKPELRYQTCAEIIAELENLELANDHLSFFEGADGAGAPKSFTGKAAKTHTPSGGATQGPAAKLTDAGQSPVADEFYYWSLKEPGGKLKTKKVRKEQLAALLKAGALDAQAQVSRTAKGGYRALGTFVEFQHIIQGAITREKAEKKTDKFKSIYGKLEEQEKTRQRWKFIENIYLKTGNFVFLLLWLAIIAGVLVGGFFLVQWGITTFGQQVKQAGQL
ncbi:MAG: serine/threonine protein kinase [Planctomycetes bacterium]|nr:serine/threonine protein kinase [Planctomycetota bacterium]